MKLTTRNVCKFAPAIMAGMLLVPASSDAATLVSQWTMNNPSPYTNSVSGGPAMNADGGTRAPATFDADETRLELDYGSPRSTRLSAVSTTLQLNTFSFSMVIDPTDMANFTTLLQKESGASNAFADYQRVGWQVLHTEFGNMEFVIRGTDPGSKDFYGSLVVTGASSGMSAGANFDSDIRYQIAGGYDSTNGAAYFYVTALGGALTNLNGSTAFKDAGAVQDDSALSVGSARSGSDFVSYGAGFDLADLQVYDDLLSENDLLFLANNPGQSVPEPTVALIGCLGMLSLLRRRM